MSKRNLGPIVGATIIEKGTRNATATKADGSFVLIVANSNTILTIYAIGFQETEVNLNGKDSIIVSLKQSCNIDWFDSKNLGFSLVSGVIHNPFGAQINITSPVLHKNAILNAVYSFQNNFKENKFSNAELSILHLGVTCGFNADARAFYHKISFDNILSSTCYSIQTDLNFRKIKYIVGISKVGFSNAEKNKEISSVGPLIGAGGWVAGRSAIYIGAQVSVYKELAEYQVKIDKRFKMLNSFIRFYKIGDFSELSIGIGKTITYRFKPGR